MERTLDTVPVSQWGFFDESIPPIVIAGPCSAESELQMMMTAKGLHDFGIHVFRAGIWKPRTHPGSFEGIDGGLIGGASLKAGDFMGIVTAF